MKKFALLFILLSVPLLAIGQRTKNVSVLFDADDFDMYVEDGFTYVSSDTYNLSFGSNPATPAIPYVSVSVLIGPNETLAGFTYSQTDSVYMTDVILGPNPAIYPTNMLYIPTDTVIVNYTDSIYPSERCRCSGVFSIGGYKILSFQMAACEFETYTHSLKFSCSYSLQITLTEEQGDSLRCNTDMKESVENMVVNPEDMNVLYGNGPVFGNPTGDKYPYLIITRDSIKAAFDELVQWKTLKGLRAKVLTVEEIEDNSNYTGDIPMKIKQVIKDYCRNHDTKFVLLGGNHQLVPSRMCYIRFERHDTTGQLVVDQDTTPADCYYSDLATMDWDGNHNHIYGEIGDTIILGPNIYVGRLPFFRFYQAQSLAERIVKYEKADGKDDWDDKILLAGMEVFGHNAAGQSDAQSESERMYEESIAPYWHGSVFRLFDTMTDYPEGANYGYTAEHLQHELEKGYSFVNVDSHGDSHGQWCTIDSTNYTLAYAQTLENPRNTMFVTTSACFTNGFDRGCVSRSMFCNVNSGIIGYLGSSRYSWAIASPKFNSSFYKCMLEGHNPHYGLLVNKTKNEEFLSGVDTYNDTSRWLYMSTNFMGDPAMTIYPQMSYIQNIKDADVEISLGNDYMLSVNSLDSTCVCVSSADDCGQQFYIVSGQIGGFVSGQNPASKCNVCVTKENHVPYLCTLFITNVIQNETLTGKVRILYPHKIEIGRNIESHIPEGPVVVESGKTLVKSPQGVIIRNGFKVEKGASFVIGS